MNSITQIVQETLMNNGEPLKAIASKISKPYPTLLRELNPYDKGAKLGAETLLDLMQVTKDYRPLQYIAEQLGFHLVPKMEATAERALPTDLVSGHWNSAASKQAG